MKIQDKMHPAQVAILHALLFRPSAGFAELQKASQLTSDHFNFHLKQMIAQEVVAKDVRGHYILTQLGKEYANRFDTDAREVERQPKVAVLMVVERSDGRHLCQQRLKQPFYGFWCRPTGKIRWGEKLVETAARELDEEAGLTADWQLKGVYHKIDHNQETGQLLEDKIFFTMHGTNPHGELKETFDGGRNAWMTLTEVAAQDKVFEGMSELIATIRGTTIEFREQDHHYATEHY